MNLYRLLARLWQPAPAWDGDSYCTECGDPATVPVLDGTVSDTPLYEMRCEYCAGGAA